MAATRYILFQAHEANVWTKRGELEAASAEAAIRKHVEKAKDGGTFAAVPSRSFTVQTLEVVSEPRVRVVGAGHAAPAHPPAPKADAAA